MFAEILCKSFGEQSDIVSFIAHQMFTKVENFDLKKGSNEDCRANQIFCKTFMKHHLPFFIYCSIPKLRVRPRWLLRGYQR